MYLLLGIVSTTCHATSSFTLPSLHIDEQISRGYTKWLQSFFGSRPTDRVERLHV
jgi:hypothetical protein